MRRERTSDPDRSTGWKWGLAFLVLAPLAMTPADGLAQEMEPRSYAPAPVGVNFLALSYLYSTGNVVTDSSLPVADVQADLNQTVVGFVRTFGFLGRSSKLLLLAPFANLEASGTLYGEPASASWRGWADPRLKFTFNFLGAPALKLPEFVKDTQHTIMGLSVQVIAPLGKYENHRLINLGANRWALKGEVGLSKRVRRWYLEISGAATVFTANDDFLQGNTVQQDPLTAVQGHVVYVFRPGLWLALDSVWVWGGQTSLNGVQRADLQTSTRLGLTFSLPVSRRHSLKVIAASGMTTRIGAEFDSVGLAWQFRWGGGI